MVDGLSNVLADIALSQRPKAQSDSVFDDRPVQSKSFTRGAFWYGPALNSPGHELHRCRPVMFQGRHIGWINSTLTQGTTRHTVH